MIKSVLEPLEFFGSALRLIAAGLLTRGILQHRYTMMIALGEMTALYPVSCVVLVFLSCHRNDDLLTH